MSQTVQAPAVPAGWYPDPMGGGGTRWWDGVNWTAHTTPAPEPEPVGPADLGPNDWWMELGSPNTVWAWLLVVSPYIWGVVVGLSQAALGSAFSASVDTVLPALGWLTFAVGLIPSWIFAGLDRRLLRRRGYEGLPSLLWMLLLPPFGYLLRRRRAVRREGEKTTGLDVATLIVGVLVALKAVAIGIVLSIGLAFVLSMMGPSLGATPDVQDLPPGAEGTTVLGAIDSSPDGMVRVDPGL